ncbi:hypothetical protein LXEBMM8_EKPBGFGD_02587 [Lactiplantibacillus xiangfangensis]
MILFGYAYFHSLAHFHPMKAYEEFLFESFAGLLFFTMSKSDLTQVEYGMKSLRDNRKSHYKFTEASTKSTVKESGFIV